MTPIKKACQRPALLAIIVVASWIAGCQRSEQAPVQPEKLASSSASDPATAPPTAPADGAAEGSAAQGSAAQGSADAAGAVPGPLVPYAKGKAPQPQPAAGAETPPGPPKPLEVVAAPGQVKLISAGEEPRKKLRIAAKVGHSEQMEMTMLMNIGMELDGKKTPSGALPPMVMTMDLKVVEARGGGDLKYDFVLSKTDVPPVQGIQPQIVDAMKKGLARLVGLKGHAVVSDRGITREAAIQASADADPQTKQIMQGMEQAMNQIGAPFPEEPVGLHAEWQHVNKLSQNGVHLTQVANYTLSKVEADQVVCDVVIQQRAPKQAVASPLGVTVDLLGLQSAGSGKTKLRFDRLSPVKSLISLDSLVTMNIPDNGQNKLMKMTSKLQIKVETPTQGKAP